MFPLNKGCALVVEDNPDTQEWLVSCVHAAFPELEIVTAANLALGQELIHRRDFELALIDLGLPDGSGIELIKGLSAKAYATYIVVATIYDDDKNLFAALKSGAKGYILKDQDRERIVSYLKGIQKNRPPLSAASSARLISHFNSKGDALERSSLTPRETEVVCLIGKGYSVEDTAAMLKLSPDTIKGYIKGVYAKLGVGNRAELTLEAVRLGIIDSV
ncbi:MAG: response regulator [Gammaproteobacteria bacterium]